MHDVVLLSRMTRVKLNLKTLKLLTIHDNAINFAFIFPFDSAHCGVYYISACS